MIVVSDTSPICYLVLIGEIELLPSLYSRVLIPRAVRRELEHPLAPPDLRRWTAEIPSWLDTQEIPSLQSPDLDALHPGEREVIQLAEILGADLVILDDKRAREAASRRGLSVTGLLGILDQAATRGLISLAEVFERLQQTSFRAEPRILKMLLDRHALESGT